MFIIFMIFKIEISSLPEALKQIRRVGCARYWDGMGGVVGVLGNGGLVIYISTLSKSSFISEPSTAEDQ